MERMAVGRMKNAADGHSFYMNETGEKIDCSVTKEYTESRKN